MNTSADLKEIPNSKYSIKKQNNFPNLQKNYKGNIPFREAVNLYTKGKISSNASKRYMSKKVINQIRIK